MAEALGRNQRVSQFDLHANKFGARGVAVFFQPIGVNESWAVIVRRGENSGEKGGIIDHQHLACGWDPFKPAIALSYTMGRMAIHRADSAGSPQWPRRR